MIFKIIPQKLLESTKVGIDRVAMVVMQLGYRPFLIKNVFSLSDLSETERIVVNSTTVGSRLLFLTSM